MRESQIEKILRAEDAWYEAANAEDLIGKRRARAVMDAVKRNSSTEERQEAERRRF
ncbi:hypothetical protein [Acrocarpospora catenulata]|uniref:hypothetical protein n=1 Tax=Acrocarpospora catenulata TaxID=2836182 RepID=UPI001BD94047|nr:hypothetical protein [Acrocarpospora catenulata]